MRILVVGADRVDAGKTTFSTGLVDRLDAVGYKPRAGNDYWFDYDDYRAAIEEGRLYGKDARRLVEASSQSIDVTTVNPIHRLWRPSPGGGSGLLGPSGRTFVCDRVAGSFVVNAGATVPRSARESLRLEDAVEVSTVAELNEVTERRHLPALEAVGRRIVETDRAVVESYADIARPLQGVVDGEEARDLYDVVAVVAPGRVRMYDGDRYVRATAVASASPHDGRMERRVEDVVEHLDPMATVSLEPIEGERRTEPGAVAGAYADAYDRILDLA